MDFNINNRIGLRNNCFFELIVGYDDGIQLKNKVDSFISGCNFQNIFLNATIAVPTFDITNHILSFVHDNNVMNLNENTMYKIIDNIFEMLSKETKEKLISIIMKLLGELKNKKINSSQIRNSFIRIIYSLSVFFIEPLKSFDKEKKVNMFYEGVLNKYDFLILSVMYKLGINIMAVFFDYKKIDFLIEPLCTIIDGKYKTKIEFKSKKTDMLADDVNRNDWLNFSLCIDIGDYIDLLIQNSDNRINNGYNVLSLRFIGVSDRQKYEFNVNKLYLSIKSKRHVFIIDDSFSNPTYEETQKFNEMQYSSKTINEILNEYICFRETSFPYYVKKNMDLLLAGSQFDNDFKRKNYEKVLNIWFIRICDKFFQDKTSIGQIPLIIIWGDVQNKIIDFLNCLGNMPIDIIQFSPNEGSKISFEPQKAIRLGTDNTEIKDFPYELKKLSRHETVAFQAEREIRDVLSSGISTIYQMKQFKELNPIVLKTTYEEIDIMWREPAKFRPAFDISADIVTIPSIFVKINGVKDNIKGYITEIQNKVTEETLLIDKPNFMSPCTNTSILDFLKQVYFKDHIDVEKIKKSQYYNYSILSVETQNVIIKGIIDFIKNDWYIKKRSSFVYDILEILLRLPQSVIQLVHNFNFTESIPKVIVLNATNIPCSAEDCILIMFLKSLGFDIIIYAPTGYRIIEEYISDELFNSINIGSYRFDLSNINLSKKIMSKKKGILGKLFM